MNYDARYYKEREWFIRKLIEFSPLENKQEVERIALVLLRNATSYCRMNEDACNNDLGNKYHNRLAQRMESSEKRISAYAEKIGATVEFGFNWFQVMFPAEDGTNRTFEVPSPN